RRLRHLGKADRRTGHPDDADTAVAQFDIGRRALQEIGGYRKDLLPQASARMMDRRRRCDRAAAGHRAEPDRDRRRIGEGEDDVLGHDPPEIGHHLGKDRLHALALRAGAARYVDLPRRVDVDECAFERPNSGPLDITADAEAEIPALLARPALALAERLDAA